MRVLPYKSIRTCIGIASCLALIVIAGTAGCAGAVEDGDSTVETPTTPDPDAGSPAVDAREPDPRPRPDARPTPPRPDSGHEHPDARPTTQGRDIGEPCSQAGECAGGTCLSLPGGYCSKMGCADSGCPEGSTCFSLQDGGSACFKSCEAPSGCRVAEGYTCDGDNTCYPGETTTDPNCSQSNPSGQCPQGQVCNQGRCETFSCGDTRYEPNESQGAAQAAPSGTTAGLEICANDKDWFKLDVPRGMIATLGATFQRASGDLDLSAHDSAGACLGGRMEHSCSWSDARYETGEEFLSVLNAGPNVKEFAWRLLGRRGATNRYNLITALVPWSDGRDCTASYPQDDCIGRPGGKLGLIQFPYADPSDPYVGDGYRFDSVSNYRWLRRETIMLVRHAIRETQIKFPGTKPLGLVDMCQRDGITPGYDIGDPRHPESTHDQGGNIDIAYYTTLASNGTLSYNEARVICDANEESNNGSFCSSSASRNHVVDLPRQVYFMAKLFESNRLRVIGVDKVIAPLLQQEARRQFELGWITQRQRDSFTSQMAHGDGWPFHHHHIHVSLEWWGGRSAHRDGCGFDLKKYR
ncbi:MAG: hypothetical protein HY698_01465 [Deltaproteobacteria bacterium]|nr:hypothetical protein [Deltaproteobacteria bacterium]